VERPTSVTVVIPAYNEGEAVIATAKALQATLAKLSIEGQVLFVDDGSTDDTSVHLAACGVDYVRHPSNRGYGAALMTGILHAKHDTIVITDSDLTYPVESLPLLLEKSQAFDMVVGARQGRFYHGSFLKRFLRIVFKFLVEFATGRRIPDINSGFRVFRRSDVLPLRRVIANGFSFTTTITLLFLLNGKQVEYVPIAYHRRAGKSHVKLVRDGLRSFQYIIEAMLAFNPIKAFLLLAFLYCFGVLAIALGFCVSQVALAQNALLVWTASCLIMGQGFGATSNRLSRILNGDRVRHETFEEK
jgi:polyisoprenyl-phosphate glycosyltransferase